jgi:hypothetical protein
MEAIRWQKKPGGGQKSPSAARRSAAVRVSQLRADAKGASRDNAKKAGVRPALQSGFRRGGER